MSRQLRFFNLLAAVLISCASGKAWATEPKNYLQTNISAAKITAQKSGYSVDVQILATDFEEMFQKNLSGLGRVDLSAPGILELEIGKFVARRVVLRRPEGGGCQGKVVKAGEDPANDEGVLVSIIFECKTDDVVYDAKELLAALGARAWQVVTIVEGQETIQKMINAESPPVRLKKQ